MNSQSPSSGPQAPDACDPFVAQTISVAGVIAVLVVDEARDAIPLARALLQGGIRVMELTLRTPTALEALRAIRTEVPEMTAGVGTILTVNQMHAAREAGAAFGVSPGCNPRLLEAARKVGFSFGPGVATPSDIETALEHGARLLKFFPAEPLGGLPYLHAMAAPYAHLGLRYIPLGGLTPANAGSYLSDPLVAAIGGSWIAPREVIKAQDWSTVVSNARVAHGIAQARAS